MGTKISQTFRVEKMKKKSTTNQKSLRGNAKNILPIGFTPHFAHESPLNPALFTHLRLFLLFLLYVEQGPWHVEAHQRQGGRDDWSPSKLSSILFGPFQKRWEVDFCWTLGCENTYSQMLHFFSIFQFFGAVWTLKNGVFLQAPLAHHPFSTGFRPEVPNQSGRESSCFLALSSCNKGDFPKVKTWFS